ncbi:malonate decarboxylase holo-ACP synthase [Pedobacter rhodius]|uniref:Malonate decarboxylase holo-ACP synthase n=1 Tax=Pedobacter rhodius TaxID=3004098 RepID=A0ABT4L219_9SPHI|nr:malonate decarboxylase holo-ACP synthase [Pedobacter sp. SJ11]MCZ4225100.1 malonate decarboxylase holo-ACP synthase [Pedobacter sp. SJ11]
MELRPHDLIRIDQLQNLVTDLQIPLWAKEAMLIAPYVVVRRAAWRNELIPVGLRGGKRGERLAAWLKFSDVCEIITPEQLVYPENWKISESDLSDPIVSLKKITGILKSEDFHWGPTGSAGFELATGIKTLTSNSDLDLVLRVSKPLSLKLAASLLSHLNRESLVRLDIQLDTPKGGVSLSEYVGSPTVLVKTSRGPVIIKSDALWAEEKS